MGYGVEWKGERADLVLASEVIYREENYALISGFIARTLKPDGRCVMINKNYYFGVGGSVEGYKQFLDGRLCVELEVDLSKNKKKSKKTILVLK